MNRLLLSLSCLLVAGATSATEIKIVSDNFQWKQNLSNAPIVQYLSTTGCMEIKHTPHSGIAVPATKIYKQELEHTEGEIVTVDYKGKSSPCRYRVNDIQLPFGAIVENSNENGASIRIYHDKNAGNEARVICKKTQHTGSYSFQNYVSLDCKTDEKVGYLNGTVQVSADLSSNVTIHIELDTKSMPL